MKPLIIITVMLGVLLAGYVVTNSQTAPDIGWPVELIPADEAAAYYDGRKLVNDNQRNYIDNLAEQSRIEVSP